jgi:hypothetical protein
MLALVEGEGGGGGAAPANNMEQEFDSKLRIQNSASNSNPPARSKSFAFRAPQENFTIQDFELGKIYGVGSYSKVPPFPLKSCPLLFLVFSSFLNPN